MPMKQINLILVVKSNSLDGRFRIVTSSYMLNDKIKSIMTAKITLRLIVLKFLTIIIKIMQILKKYWPWFHKNLPQSKK